MKDFDGYRGRRVLITGHTGFKGAWLSAWLLRLGAEVIGYALPPEREEDLFVRLGLAGLIHHHEGDIRRAHGLVRVMRKTKPEFVFHLAAQSMVRRSYREPITTFETNLMGSVRVLEAVRDTPSVKALVYVTTDKCYRNRGWAWGYRENDELGGRDPYSASKACAEIAFASYVESFLHSRVSFAAASVRAGNVIGGGDWAEDRLVPDCIRALQKGAAIRIRHPEATRPWQHVLEPLGGYLLLAVRLSGSAGKAFQGPWNFGPIISDCWRVRELAEAVITEWGSGEIELLAPSIDDPPEASVLQLSIDKASAQLGWRPVLSVSEAVRETVGWYKSDALGLPSLELAFDQIDRYSSLMPSRIQSRCQ